MKDELIEDKIKRAKLALMDLVESGIYGTFHFEKEVESWYTGYPWSEYDINELLYKLEKHQTNLK